METSETPTIRGSIVALVTPMLKNGEIDEGAFKALLDWHIAMGSAAAVIAGTTGESPTLTLEENRRLTADAVKCSNGRMPIIGGVGANATAEAVALTKQAAEDGADAGLSVIPYYNRPTQEGLFRHFSAVADASNLPIILYDVPKRCGTTFETATLVRLSEHQNIIGLKDATGDLRRLHEHRKKLPDNFLLYSGDDGTAADYISGGGNGVISVSANIAPKRMSDMCRAALDGDKEKARHLDSTLRAMHTAQGAESNPIPIKWALSEEGRIGPALRLPLTPLSERHHNTVRAAVNNSRQEENE